MGVTWYSLCKKKLPQKYPSIIIDAPKIPHISAPEGFFLNNRIEINSLIRVLVNCDGFVDEHGSYMSNLWYECSDTHFLSSYLICE